MTVSGPLRSIGEVVRSLSEEFPEVSVSKIRYLEGRGIVEPARTSGGKRRYSDADIAVLRRVLRLQRDAYLPLDVIRERLAEEDAGTGSPDRPIDDESDRVDPRVLRRRRRPYSADELCDLSGIDRQTLDDIVSYGLVAEFDDAALAVCRAVAGLLAFGIQPRHLRAFRSAADREIGLVEAALAAQGVGAAGGADAHVRAEEHRRALLARCLDLHVALVRAGLDSA